MLNLCKDDFEESSEVETVKPKKGKNSNIEKVVTDLRVKEKKLLGLD